MKRASGRARRRIHVHLLNAPEIAAYAVRPDDARTRLSRLARAHRADLVVSEDHDADVVTPAMREATVLIGFNLPRRRIAELRELRWIHLVSAGVNHLLPLDWLPPGVALTNSSGVHSELAGEYAAAAILMLNIGMPRHATSQRVGRWKQVFNSPLRGKTVVLVGVGAIGGSAARHFKRLGLHVVGIRPTRQSHRHVDEMHGPEQLRKVLPAADFLVVTAPLTPETRGLIGGAELDLLRPQAGLVNMSRAGLVDYDALRARLEAGRLRGAIVDVTDPEPLPSSSPLWNVPDFLITPHISSDPVDYVERMLAIIEDNLGRLLRGRRLRNLVDPRRGY
jgi:phosphoglycerate dehydrogenase-like enzyme